MGSKYKYSDAENHACLLECGDDSCRETVNKWFKNAYPDRHTEGDYQYPASDGFNFRLQYHRWLWNLKRGRDHG